MALKIRLRQQGRTNRPFYRLVVTDVRAPRDGKYIEMLGWYNPLEATLERNLLVKADRVQHWIEQGAELSENVANLIKKVAPDVMRFLQDRDEAHRAKKRIQRKKQESAT